MLMQTKSISDAQLLWRAGFTFAQIQPGQVTTEVDLSKVCTFFDITQQTAKRWLKSGIPRKARHQLELLYQGDFLPATWRKANLKLCDDGILLADGRLVRLGTIQFWPFLMQAVSWDKVPDLVKARSL